MSIMMQADSHQHPNLSASRIMYVLTRGSRDAVIDWLCWHDPNGCYTDEDCEREGCDPLTLDEAREIMTNQLAEGADEYVTLE